MKKISIFLVLLLIPLLVWGESSTQIDNYTYTGTASPAIADDGTQAIRTTVVDADGNQITAFGSPSTIATYRSPSDFTAAFTSGTTITLTSPPTITDDSQIVYIKVIPAATASEGKVYVNGSGGVTFREAANVITIYGAGTTPFVTGDVYEVGINGQDKAYDATNALDRIQEQSPVWERYTDVVTLEDTPKYFTAAWVDLGAEVSCIGYHTQVLWLTLDINDTVNAQIRGLAKHTTAGAEEYNFVIKTPSATLINVAPEVYEITTDADGLYAISFSCDNAIPYIQYQIYAAVPGATAGQIDAAYITKGW